MRNFLTPSFWLLLFITVLGAGRNPYEILGVSKQANISRIKKAYRNLSKTHHPDRNPNDPKAAEKFSDITWSYEILTNETLRTAFDRGGEEAVKAAESGRPMPGRGGPTQFFFGGDGGIPFIFRQAFTGAGGSGGGFPGGGFPGGAFPGGGFPGGGRPGGGAGFQQPPQPQLVNLDWFNDTPVRVISSPADLESLGKVWPDIIMTIRSDSPDTEKASREFITTAEQLDTYLEFEALDCRRSRAHLCSALGKHGNRPFEISIVYQVDKESPRDSGVRVSHTSPKSMTASTLRGWILDRLPTVSTTASNPAALKKVARSGKPVILLVTQKPSEVPIRLRQWAIEQQQRAIFVLAGSASLKEKMIAAIAKKEPVGQWTAFAILIADPAVISPETIEWMEMSEAANTDFTVDLTLAKWIAMWKKQSGPYARARRAIRIFEPNQKGICDNTDSVWCIFYFGPLQHPLHKNFEESVSKSRLDAKFYILDNENRATFKIAASFGLEAGTPALVAFKGKRNKFVRYKNSNQSVTEWIDSLHDTSILMREGAKRDEF